MSRLWRPLLLVLWLVFGALSLAFAYTDGLAMSGYPGLRHARELQSSGGNDDLCIEAGVLLAAAAALWNAPRFRRRFGRADAIVNGFLAAAQVLYLALIEAGSIPETLARDHNLVLAAWLATFAAIVGCVAVVAAAPRLRPPAAGYARGERGSP